MKASPSMRVQRTGSHAWTHSEPLTRRLLGVAIAGVAVVFLTVGCGSTGIKRYCCPSPENGVVVHVATPFKNGLGQIGLDSMRAKVLLRDVDGSVLFTQQTSGAGIATIPIDFRAVRNGMEVEAQVDLGNGRAVGALEVMRPNIREYHLIVAPLDLYLQVEEPGIKVNGSLR